VHRDVEVGHSQLDCIHVTLMQTGQTSLYTLMEITRSNLSTLLHPRPKMQFLRPNTRIRVVPTVHIIRRTFTTSPSLQNAANTQRQLGGKRCIITGASRGIGAEIARRFAREGARCLLIGRNETLLEKVKGELEKVEGQEHRILVGDVGDGYFWGLLKKEVSPHLYI
jgi:FlaA1/EpsC-like NDP-sugar epimerase